MRVLARGSSPSADAGSFESAAAAVQRLAVLLDAGLTPLSAWRAVADAGAPAPLVEALGSGTTAGTATVDDLARGLLRASAAVPPEARSTWSVLAATLLVAVEAGSPLAPTLTRSAAVLRDLAQNARDIDVAMASPAATTRIVVVLPFLSILLGTAMGFDVLPALIGTAAGRVAGVAGILLLAGGWLWMRRMLRGASISDAAPGIHLELAAVALGGGADVQRARGLAARAIDAAGLEPDERGVDAVLEFARQAGAPAGVLLRAEAEETRRSAASAARRQAEVLGVRLMIPLGVCVLPSFLALGVVPIVIALVKQTPLQL